ncbi:MAG TPA: serine hydrolase domain-containing protein [Nocardioidaceae bacterium]|nr:serine hydrolase domain-containing protein [Nocardioidaceae bacterium]
MRRRSGFHHTRVGVVRAVIAALLAIGVVAVPAFATAPADESQSYAASARRDSDHSGLVKHLHADLQSYLRNHRTAEHVSAAALSVSLPGHRATIDVGAGTTRFGGDRPVRSASVWQIGSNTKAFTSVLMLQLEAEQRVSIHDTLGKWLPQYPQWRHVTIKRLLNMTSGIPSYDAQPEALEFLATHPYHYFSPRELVSYVVGRTATHGYSYSNTNYVLAEMIIEKVTHDGYRHQLYARLIEPLGLHDLYYRAHLYPRWVTAREPAGYFFVNQGPTIPGLVGRDVSRWSLSWARGAGGIISTTHDMTVWERALYDGRLLPPKQQAELMSLVSMTTGKPIERTSSADPGGFGLGVAQGTHPKFGTVWLYEGGTLGFRTLHIYFPGSGVIMAMGLNSYPAKDDIVGLAASVYDTLVSHGLIRPSALGGGHEVAKLWTAPLSGAKLK